MIGDYTIFEKSMNGIKTLSDGISMISDGDATHDTITYNETLQSSDERTILTNSSVATEDITCVTLGVQDLIATDLSSNSIECNSLTVYNNSNLNTISVSGASTFNAQINLINSDLSQTQGSRIVQQGTNANSLKDTSINGYLNIGSNIVQSGGSSSLKDVTMDSLTMNQDKSITQQGINVSNSLAGTTTVKDLIITNSVILPANISIPDFTTDDDIIMQSDSVIIQDITVTTTNKNILRDTKVLNLEIDGNLNQSKAGATCTLKNTTIQGSATIQGDITQTTGSCVLKTINCNNITLNTDQNITQSGSGYLTQSGTGQNIMKEISLISNANLIQNGNGIISQALGGQNIFSHFRSAGYGIIGGRNNTTFSNTANIQNNNGLQIQFNRDNSSQYSFLMNNRGTGGNGGFRFQRYIGGVYVDEPIVIDDNVTINKNVNIPGGSLACSSATIGNISQSELNCLDNCSQNINDKFISLDAQIASINTTNSSNSTALTGISYISGTDTTLIDNNITVTSGKNLLLGTTNVLTSLTNDATNIATLTTNTNGITYSASNNYFNNQCIFDGNVQLSKTNGSTYIFSDFRLVNGVTKNVNEFAQTYCANNNWDNVLYRPGGNYQIYIRNVANTSNIQVLQANLTNFNIKNTNALIDNNLTVNGTTNLQNTNVTGNLVVNGMNIKNQIDALNTSFTTGTINTTDLVTSNLTANGTTNLKTTNVITSIGTTSTPSLIVRDNGNTSFTRTLAIIPNSSASAYNANVAANDLSLVASGTSINQTSLSLTTWSSTKSGLRIGPQFAQLTAGTNNMLLDSSSGLSVTGNLNVSNSVTINNDLTVNDSINVANTFQTFPNVVASSNFSEQATTTIVGSTPTVDLCSVIITEPFSKEIYVNLSLSGGLQWQNPTLNILNRIQYTVKYNTFNVSIYKNGTLWQSNITMYNSVNQFQENTFRIVYSQFAAYFKYFMNNTQFRFAPDFNTTATTDVYTFRLTFNLVYDIKNYNVSTDSLSTFTGTFTSFIPTIYASVNYTYNGTDTSLVTGSSTVDIITYLHGTYTASNYTINHDVYRFGMDTNSIREMQMINTFTNKAQINNLTATNATLSNATINNATMNINTGYVTNNLRCKSFIAGYLINGNTPYALTPIYCSLNGISPNNDDDYYIIMPGFKFELYDGQYYNTLKQTITNNSTNDSPECYAVTFTNTTSSIRVFFRPTNTSAWTEIKFSPISLDINGN